ncbi:DUF7344 domain-containing protein [Salinigranum halophilum]|jgi:hypothetical protein|uniref:DUF7344 domain-containing protein n=1 Tax=Salinigranum halophilum TaxID=2565931 RepID=UPI00115F0DD3|nr:hypothetical protein [Salinigranum halophilum]
MADDHVRRAAADVLRNPHRRYILAHLNGQQKPLTVRRLAEAIVEWERASTADTDTTPDGQSVDEVMVRLHHEHLPYLAQQGVLSYDWRHREIADWRHPNLGEEWVSSFPVERLYEVVE